MRLFRTSLDQAGAALFVNNEGEEKVIPLFSSKPLEEANGGTY